MMTTTKKSIIYNPNNYGVEHNLMAQSTNSSDFMNRFKGKVIKINKKDGHLGVVKATMQPIHK